METCAGLMWLSCLAGVFQGSGRFFIWGDPVGASSLAAALGRDERLPGE